MPKIRIISSSKLYNIVRNELGTLNATYNLFENIVLVSAEIINTFLQFCLSQLSQRVLLSLKNNYVQNRLLILGLASDYSLR